MKFCSQSLEDRTASKQEENPLYELQAGDSGYGSSLNEEHEYADIGVKKKQSHSFLTENKRSATKHITAKSDPKSHVSKNPPSTQVSVKEVVAQIEKGKGGR